MRDRLFALLRTVPPGRVVTYGQLAAALGCKGLARAVGNALHTNPDPSVTPCYRVVDAKGTLSRAFAHGGLEAQRRMLQAEGVRVDGMKVDLTVYRFDGF